MTLESVGVEFTNSDQLGHPVTCDGRKTRLARLGAVPTRRRSPCGDRSGQSGPIRRPVDASWFKKWRSVGKYLTNLRRNSDDVRVQ